MQTLSAIHLKGEMSLLNILHLHTTDLSQIQQELQHTRDRLPQLFEHTPLVIDCAQLDLESTPLDLGALHTLIQSLGFVPVGIRHIPEALQASVEAAGWAWLRTGKSHTPRVDMPEPAVVQNAAPSNRAIQVVERPLRSGQQLYFPEGDLVLLQNTSAGSEILAGGSVHVYGSLRGRVLAGVNGDTNARIFCQKLEAELIAIAGNYRLLEDIDAEVKGQPAMIWLDGEKLRIAPM